jgi:hypothetical protein
LLYLATATTLSGAANSPKMCSHGASGISMHLPPKHGFIPLVLADTQCRSVSCSPCVWPIPANVQQSQTIRQKNSNLPAKRDSTPTICRCFHCARQMVETCGFTLLNTLPLVLLIQTLADLRTCSIPTATSYIDGAVKLEIPKTHTSTAHYHYSS